VTLPTVELYKQPSKHDHVMQDIISQQYCNVMHTMFYLQFEERCTQLQK